MPKRKEADQLPRGVTMGDKKHSWEGRSGISGAFPGDNMGPSPDDDVPPLITKNKGAWYSMNHNLAHSLNPESAPSGATHSMRAEHIFWFDRQTDQHDSIGWIASETIFLKKIPRKRGIYQVVSPQRTTIRQLGSDYNEKTLSAGDIIYTGNLRKIKH